MYDSMTDEQLDEAIKIRRHLRHRHAEDQRALETEQLRRTVAAFRAAVESGTPEELQAVREYAARKYAAQRITP